MAKGVYTEDMGQPPSPPDMGSAPPPPKKKAAPDKKKPRGIRGGVWTEDSDIPAPSPVDMGSADRKLAKGGKVSSASKRADGIAKRGKTRGMFV